MPMSIPDPEYVFTPILRYRNVFESRGEAAIFFP